MKAILGLAVLMFYLLVILAWPINAYRFCKCDFKESYKGEVIHGAGLFTPTFLITAWANWDK